MSEIITALKGLAPGTGTVQVAVFIVVLVADLIASMASTFAAVMGGRAPSRIGYSSSMGAMLGGVLWFLAAWPHALIMGVLTGMAMTALGY